MSDQKRNKINNLLPKMQGGDSQSDNKNVIPTHELPGLAGFCQLNKEQPKMKVDRNKIIRKSKAGSPSAMPLQISFLEDLLVAAPELPPPMPIATEALEPEASSTAEPAEEPGAPSLTITYYFDKAVAAAEPPLPPAIEDDAVPIVEVPAAGSDGHDQSPELSAERVLAVEVPAIKALVGSVLATPADLVPPDLITTECLLKVIELKVIDARQEVAKRQRQVRTTAVEKVAQIVERNRKLLAGAAPWSCAGLNRVLYSQPPRVFQMSERNFQNTLWALRSVLICAGVHADSGNGRNKLSSAWDILYGRLTEDARKRLIRFFRFLTLKGIEPDAVPPDALEAFDKWVRNDILEPDPCKLVRCAASSWTSALKSVAGWPQIPLTWPGMRDHYAIPFSRFPTSFQQEVEAFEHGLMPLTMNDTANPFAGLKNEPSQVSRLIGYRGPGSRQRGTRRVTAPRTVTTRMEQIRYASSALVLSGCVPLEAIASLRDLVHPFDRPIAILEWHLARDQDRKRQRGQDKPEVTSTHLARIGDTLVYIANRLGGFSEEELEKLKGLVALIKPKQQSEMSPKNRAALGTLFEPPIYRRLMNLSKRWMKDIKKQNPDPKKAAVHVVYVIAMSVLLFLPLRRENLVQLRLDENIVYGPRGLPSRIFIAANRVKNNRTIDWPIPAEDSALLDLYIRVYRPMLPGQENNPYLFPSEGGGHRNESAFGSTLAERVTRYLGADFFPHLARHFAAVQYLRGHPSDYATVADILGHKTIEITRKYYCGLETDAAARRYDDLMKKERQRVRLQPVLAKPRLPKPFAPMGGK